MMTAIPSSRSAPARPDRIAVWDLPTRIFHWGLAAGVLVSWITGEDEGLARIHRVSGEIIAGLVVFRIVWGFIGGKHARFADFVRGPRAAASHLRDLLRGRVEPALGHNPLGGISVLLLLISVCCVVVTGLFSTADDGRGGPLAGAFGWDLSALHEPAFRLLQFVVVLHLLGVVATSLLSRDNLVAAMITGSKRRRADAPAAPTRSASTAALLVAVALGCATSAYLVSLPQPDVRATEGPSGSGASATGLEDHGPADRSQDND